MMRQNRVFQALAKSIFLAGTAGILGGLLVAITYALVRSIETFGDVQAEAGIPLAILASLGVLLLGIGGSLVLGMCTFMLVGTAYITLMGGDNLTSWSKEHLQSVDDQAPPERPYDFVGYRMAYLLPTANGVRFGSITNRGNFGVRGEAVCMPSDPMPWKHSVSYQHEAPHPDCQCGFYSKPTAADLEGMVSPYGTSVLLECSYTGTIIPGTKGARAQTQTVLRLWLPHACSQLHCSEAAEALYLLTSKSGGSFTARCAEHAPSSGQRWSLADLRRELGIDVAFV